VVDRTPTDTDTVFFGAWVTIEDEEGIETQVRIVGPDEFDQHRDYISMDSPMARALLKRKLDDDVSVTTPTGQKHYVIVEINYR
jgi:transcription elongation factor GreB